MKTIKNKVAVITGAGSGIGRALARLMAKHGCHLAIADVNPQALAETAASISGVNLSQHVIDCGKPEDIESLYRESVHHHGAVDILVNNAGVALAETVENMSMEDFHWLFNINFWGVVNGTKTFLPHLRTRPEAHIVNISSVFGIIAVPTQSAYNASKFAVKGFTECLKQELADTPVGVTCVHPGGIKTNIVRNGRMYRDQFGAASDVAKMAMEFDKVARTTPEQAAQTIHDAILGQQERLLIGTDAQIIDFIQRLFPNRYPKILRFVMEKAAARSK